MRRGEEHYLTLDALRARFYRSNCTDPRDVASSVVSRARDIDLKEWLRDYSTKGDELMIFKKAFEQITLTIQTLDMMYPNDK